jgi:hypothetical protein
VYKYVMRTLFCLIVVGCVAAQGIVAQAAPRPQRTIPCDEIIDFTPFPRLGSSNPRDQARLVLNSVMAPPAYLAQTSPTGETPWRYFSKRGMVVRSGKSVTITVPVAWRQRVGMSWGNGGHGVFHTIRIASCFSDPKRGNAYAGGFFLRSSSACVPLVFIVGNRQQELWFGVGQRCR